MLTRCQLLFLVHMCIIKYCVIVYEFSCLHAVGNLAASASVDTTIKVGLLVISYIADI